jgi:hypothetical protein
VRVAVVGFSTSPALKGSPVFCPLLSLEIFFAMLTSLRVFHIGATEDNLIYHVTKNPERFLEVLLYLQHW